MWKPKISAELANLLNPYKRDSPENKKSGIIPVGGSSELSEPPLSVVYFYAFKNLYVAITEFNKSGLIKPALFLARHSVELALKEIILASRQLKKEPVDDPENKIFKTHVLKTILEIAEKEVQCPQNWKELVEQINQFEDDAPDRFRFSLVKKSKQLEPAWSSDFFKAKRVDIKKYIQC